ncbi:MULTISPECIES: hypothetical protein [unclassified Ruegeria]|uniref:hypothetical protein n=1 Tax=unclassified Ruegeria TaxID=2625375 RepID=UPI001492F48F|nr:MULTISPECIES: hypothetical protein [unclassified Ruegeria]NOD88368.1 hypothetical protein [Ruegeria sp. HKCCD4318]NOE13277.1 hypothetical protein [Ruegeria sp. HKCCD4318-2]NOG11181.1 hypothetical protein [Ruegeria sp. HKCCD4315]
MNKSHDNSEQHPSITAARIGVRGSIFVAVIGAIASVLVVVADRLVSPPITTEDVQQQIDDSLPSFKFFPQERTNQSNEVALEGEWQICTLATAGTVHHTQACTCSVSTEDEVHWTLETILDDSVTDGFCRCEAACFNFATRSDS